MPWAFLGLEILGPVFFAGMLLVALSVASSATTKPHGEATGIFGTLTLAFRAAVDAWHSLVRHAVSHIAAAHLVPLVRWFTAATALVRLSAKTQADYAEETATAVERMRHVVVPREVGKGVAPAKASAKAANRAAHRANAHAGATSTALGRYKVATNKRLAHQAHAIDVTLPRTIGGIRAREEALSRDQAALRKRTAALEDGGLKTFEWIRAHPLAGVTAVFAGAVAVALSRLGYGFLRCRSWRGVGKRVTCGMGSLLEEILGGAIEAFIVSDLCEFIGLLSVAAAQFEPILFGFIDVEDALIGCHGATTPPGFSLPPLDLPPTTAGLSLAA